jgi:hypothetical protein
MPASDALSLTDDRAADDLQAIAGVGPAYARALAAAGVQRFADMARFASTVELQQALHDSAGVDVPLWKIENYEWLAQARRLAGVTTSANPTRPVYWHQHAGFSLFFDTIIPDFEGEVDEPVWQTRTYHEESGEQELFAGVDMRAWGAWILAKANLPVPDGAEPQVAPAVAEPLTILDVTAREARPTFGILRTSLIAEMTVHVPAARATGGVGARQIRWDLYLVDLATQTSALAATEQCDLDDEDNDYTLQTEFDFPNPGRYRLHNVVILLPPADGIAVRQGPIMTIET